MKKMIVVFLIIVLAFSLTACDVAEVFDTLLNSLEGFLESGNQSSTNHTTHNNPTIHPTHDNVTAGTVNGSVNETTGNVTPGPTNYRVDKLILTSPDNDLAFELHYAWEENSCEIVMDENRVIFRFDEQTNTLEITDPVNGPFASFTFDEEGYIIGAIFYRSQDIIQNIEYTNEHNDFVWDLGGDESIVNGSVVDNNIIFTQNGETVTTVGYSDCFISNLDRLEITPKKDDSGRLESLSYSAEGEEVIHIAVGSTDVGITHSWELIPLAYVNALLVGSYHTGWASTCIAICYAGR